LAATGSVAAILVVVASALTTMLRAGAIVATTGSPGAVVVAAAFGADRAMMCFAADQTVTAVELCWPVATA